MAGLVAMEANREPLRTVPRKMSFLPIFVAYSSLARPVMALAALPTSAAPRTARPQISGLCPLGGRLRLCRSPITPLRLGLLPRLCLKLNLPLPSICLELGKCLVSRVRHELTDVPPQYTQITAHASLLSGHQFRAKQRLLMKHPRNHCHRLSPLLEGQKLLG